MERTKAIFQTTYSYTMRELAEALGLSLTPTEWVVVEVDEDMVDIVRIREGAVDRRPHASPVP